MVVFDATALLLLMRPGVRAPIDPATGGPVEHAEQRIAHLVETLEQERTKIIVPTPALSELLVRAGNAAPQLIARLSKSAAFQIVPFGARAAVELAEMTRLALDAGDKRGGVDAIWSKIKFDRQIIAISKVEGAQKIYSDDHDLRKAAEAQGLKVIGLANLPIPEHLRQGQLPLPGPEK